MSKFSDWLNKQISQKGVGINQLATYTGLSSSGVSKLRLGQRNPEPETILKLADYFKVDPDWLLVLAGHRRPLTTERDWEMVEDPELRVWLSAKNINRLAPASRRAILSIIQADVGEQEEEEEREAVRHNQAGNSTTPKSSEATNSFSWLESSEGPAPARITYSGKAAVLAYPLKLSQPVFNTSSQFVNKLLALISKGCPYGLFLAGTILYSQLLSLLISSWVNLFSDWSQKAGGELITFLAYAVGLWCLPAIVNLVLLPLAIRSQNNYFKKYQARHLKLRHWDWLLRTPIGVYYWFCLRCILQIIIDSEHQD
jgi:transcriptional regulator with XRE-family HTH domain